MLSDQLSLPSVLRVKEGCEKVGLKTFELKQVPPEYYEWELEKRREYLGAASVDHLCKSLIIENTKCRDEKRPNNSRYFCIIVQYTAQYASHNAFKFIRTLNTLPKSAFHLHFASNEESEKLTGFEFNAVAPFGMLTEDIPIIISDKIAALGDDVIWCGGGAVDVKLGFKVSELVDQKRDGVWVAPVTK